MISALPFSYHFRTLLQGAFFIYFFQKTKSGKGGESPMSEEMRLVSIGWPLSDAVSFCHSMRRERKDLERFVRAQEDDYRRSIHGARLL